jgi:ribonuclease VapC
MILDTSPLIAILAKEPDFERYVDAISRASRCRMSAGNFLELSIVIEGQVGADGLRSLHSTPITSYSIPRGFRL